MSRPSPLRSIVHGALSVALPFALGCRTATPPRPALPTPSPVSAGTPATRMAAARPADPDARFMQDMIGHHGQALVMSALVPPRTTRTDLRSLAERIAVSQRDEIATMQRWLRENGHPVPEATGHGDHAGHGAPAATQPHDAGAHAGMPGMLTADELTRLGTLTGVPFERLFLEYMIRHHEGAITMVRQLLAAGGGQRSEVFAIASEVESDQRMEIDRMRRLLDALSGPGRAPSSGPAHH